MTIINLIARKSSCFINQRVSDIPIDFIWSHDYARDREFTLASVLISLGKAAGIRERVTSPRTGTRTRIPDLRGRRTWPAYIGTVCGGTRNTIHTRARTHTQCISADTCTHRYGARHQFMAQLSRLRFRRCSIFMSARAPDDIRFGGDILRRTRSFYRRQFLSAALNTRRVVKALFASNGHPFLRVI